MNAQIATAKRLSIVPSAAGQENGFRDFSSTSVKNALEQESAFVLSAAGQASFRHNQADPTSDRDYWIPGSRSSAFVL
jgi:hypothetical protein